MESASFWSGKTTRSQLSYDHSLDSTSTSRTFGNALEPEELMPPNDSFARLLIRGTPGHGHLIDWTEFVKYLDELRAAAPQQRRPPAIQRPRRGGDGMTTVGAQMIPAASQETSLRSLSVSASTATALARARGSSSARNLDGCRASPPPITPFRLRDEAATVLLAADASSRQLRYARVYLEAAQRFLDARATR